MKNGYVKITFEDIEIANNFFENEKHLDEFMSQVCRYYCGYENVFKYKNVKKYFETYKKVMDRVIVGRSTGSIGGMRRIENQQVTSTTLEGGVQGVLEGGVEVPLQPKERKERKVINLKKETKEIYGEFSNVFLTNEEYRKATEKYKELLPRMIDKLSSFIATKKKDPYSSHYATFSSWVYNSVKEQNDKSGVVTQRKVFNPNEHYS